MLDVILIGAGVAGLAAAIELHRAGLSFVILEARTRAGGRVFTVDSSAGHKIELGAEFLHGAVPELVDRLEAASLKYVQARDDHLALSDGKLIDADQYFENTLNILEQMGRRSAGADTTFAEFSNELLKEKPELQDSIQQAKGYVEDLNACHADRVSIKWLAQAQCASDETNGDKFFRLEKGYASLVDDLISKIPAVSLRLNHPVELVNWQGNEVSVKARSDGKLLSFVAHSALITLPLSVLQASCFADADDRAIIRFEPELKEKHNALTSMSQGLAFRLTLEFKTRFWEQFHFNNFGFIHSRSLPFTTWWSQAPQSVPILVAWAAGPKADALKDMSAADISDLAISSLAHVIGKPVEDLKGELLQVHMHDWNSDPYSLGAYSHVLSGGVNAAKELALPIKGRLFFAGEATDTDGFSATVPGALRSGVRAAGEIIQAFKFMP